MICFKKVARINYYIIPIPFIILIISSCYDPDKELKKINEAYENESNLYKANYDFNVDSLMLKIPLESKPSGYNIMPAYPFIVFRKWQNKIYFDYTFNKALDKSLTSFSLNHLKTIILLENSVIDEGTYSNGKTKAERIQTAISFIDKHTMKLIKTRIIFGGDPPTSIQYRRSAPTARSGSGINDYEILQVIQNEIHVN